MGSEFVNVACIATTRLLSEQWRSKAMRHSAALPRSPYHPCAHCRAAQHRRAAAATPARTDAAATPASVEHAELDVAAAHGPCCTDASHDPSTSIHASTRQCSMQQPQGPGQSEYRCCLHTSVCGEVSDHSPRSSISRGLGQHGGERHGNDSNVGNSSSSSSSSRPTPSDPALKVLQAAGIVTLVAPSHCVPPRCPSSPPPHPALPPPPLHSSTAISSDPPASAPAFKRTFYKRDLPSPPATAFSSVEGQQLLMQAMAEGSAAGFFTLMEQFSTQDEVSEGPQTL